MSTLEHSCILILGSEVDLFSTPKKQRTGPSWRPGSWVVSQGPEAAPTSLSLFAVWPSFCGSGKFPLNRKKHFCEVCCCCCCRCFKKNKFFCRPCSFLTSQSSHIRMFGCVLWKGKSSSLSEPVNSYPSQKQPPVSYEVIIPGKNKNNFGVGVRNQLQTILQSFILQYLF